MNGVIFLENYTIIYVLIPSVIVTAEHSVNVYNLLTLERDPVFRL
jgi:hypothetical protein